MKTHTTPRRRRPALALLSALAGVAATVAVVLPTLADAPPTFVRLNVGTDGRYFEYGSTRQDLVPVKSGCQLTDASREGPVVALSSTPDRSDPGVGAGGLGVKQSPSSGNGTPCSQVDSVETLTIAGGSALGGRRFSHVRLDLEMTGDAIVELTFTPAPGANPAGNPTTYQLQTGTSIASAQAEETDYDPTPPPDGVYDASSGPSDTADACASPNSSGPNSASSDNCRWLVQPGFAFTSFSLKTTVGTVSLEGGGDYLSGGDDVDTLLFLASATNANDDTASTAEDTAVSGNVLTNDTNTGGGALTATKLTDPANGTVTLAANGAFTYTPAANFNGSDSFTYRATDGITSEDATVSITVTAVNDPPTPATTGATTNEDTTVNVTVATDIDSTDGSAACTLADEDGNLYQDRVTNAAGFTVDVAPPADFNGELTLTCTVTDAEGASASTQTTIAVGVTAVNDAPVALDDTADVDQDVSDTSDTSVLIDVVANDLDVDGDTLAPTAITDVLPAGASAVVESGQVRYTPPEDYVGPGSFKYRASDGLLTSDPATVSIDVVAVMCSGDTVSDEDGLVSGEFTRLTDPDECKRYEVDADDGSPEDPDDGTVLFQPVGSATVVYRGLVSLGPDEAPDGSGDGSYGLLLRYDPTGGTTYQPVPWCLDPVFDEDGLVTTATLPGEHSWCIAGESTKAVGPEPQLVTVWQVYGEDDPRFTR
jgi:VCBS repeat-containing protein